MNPSMKIILLYLLLSFLAPPLAECADITLQWDAFPAADEVSQVNVYERTGELSIRVAVTTGEKTEATFQADAKAHVYYITCQNIWEIESDASNDVTLPAAKPGAPRNAKVKSVKLALQSSEDAETWATVASVETPWQRRQFFRAVFEE
jgi:hypothetical protein